MKHVFLSDQGQVRPYNEDAGGVILREDGQTLYVIADGMGGHNAGDVASKMVIDYFMREWPKQSSLTRINEAEQYLIQAIQSVNKEIYDKATENKAFRGMGTTVVLVVVVEETAVIAHVGDSRCYKLSQHQLRQLTSDHSLVNALVHAGEITPDEAAVHPKKNVLTRAVGTDMLVDVEVTMVTCDNNDRLLLCTDGLTNKLTDERIQSILNQHADLHVAAEQLINEANERGGEDNISLVLLSYDAGGEAS